MPSMPSDGSWGGPYQTPTEQVYERPSTVIVLVLRLTRTKGAGCCTRETMEAHRALNALERATAAGGAAPYERFTFETACSNPQ